MESQTNKTCCKNTLVVRLGRFLQGTMLGLVFWLEIYFCIEDEKENDSLLIT